MRRPAGAHVPLIVIVDDQATNQLVYSKLVASIDGDVTVRSFDSPTMALDWMRDNTPDLVITDYKMPGMNGAEFVHNVRKLTRAGDVPIIVVTVYEERSFRRRALEAGATDFLHAPIDRYEFVTRSRNLLQLRKQQLLIEQKLEQSERFHAEAVRDSRERLAQVIDTVPAMISATDRHGGVIFANAYHVRCHTSSSHPERRDSSDNSEIEKRNKALDRTVFEANAPLPSYEEEITDTAGTKRSLLTTKSPLRDASNAVVAVLTTSIDITDRKKLENQLKGLAHYDAVTNLPNRTLLHSRLLCSLARNRRGDCSTALHLIDLDGFKTVNDVLGHSAGDIYLSVVAERLRRIVGEHDTVARLGGDEFAILQERVTGLQDAATFAASIRHTISEPHLIEGESMQCTASIGIALHPSDGVDPDQLLKNADLAMYRAKADGGNCYWFFASDMSTRARAEAALDNALREAIEQKQFRLVYQPQVNTRSGRVIGAEALLRWQHPKQGIIGPNEFLSRAEETGLIVPINEWVLREACREAKSWQRPGLPPVRISVNLSPTQFRKQSVPLLVTKILGEVGLQPGLLELELTENMIMPDREAVARDLQHLRHLGVKISIDDFGTGYSCINYVKQLPVDRLKIDQCFVRELPHNSSDAAIVRAIICLGRSLSLDVVPEGIETREQMNLLHEEGCYEMQGYYFGKPMPPQELITLLKAPHARMTA
jgi:diguanylate cyclase (GGDEF)-like protein